MKPIALAFVALTLTAADKPTPKQKARELLDGAAEMIAAAKPDVQPVALLHLADNYQIFDKKKAIEYFKQGFAAATIPPAGDSPFARTTQMEIVVALAAVDTAEGIGMLKQIQPPSSGYDNRAFAATRVIVALLEKGQMQTAIDLADYMGGAGAYPFAGVNIIMSKLKEGDPQLAALFTAALNAYMVKPDRAFTHLLASHYRRLPVGMPQAALSRILSVVVSGKDDRPYEPQTLSSSKGTVTFTTREDAELFDVAPMVREIDPKRYEDLIATHAELRSALQMYPGGGPSIADQRGITMYTVSSGLGKDSDPAAERKALEAANNKAKTIALINTRVEAVMAALAKDPDKALDLVGQIPSPPKQAEALGRIAQSVSEKDVAAARRVISRCISLLEDVKYPEDRVLGWDSVAGAALAVKDEALVLNGIDHMLSDAAELYKEDTNGDRPNRAWRENWPSTQAFRRAIVHAVKLQGVDAEPVLQKITDPDQNVLARITLAQALLERPLGRLDTYGGRPRAPQTGR
jgi:hypothetical protein